MKAILRVENGMMVKRPFSFDVMGSLVTFIITTLLSLLMGILIARFLGPGGKGLFTLVLLVVGQLALFLTLGIEISIVHFAGQKKWSIHELSSTSIGLGLLLGMSGIMVAIIIFTWGFYDLIPNEVLPSVFLMTSIIPITLVVGFMRSMIRVSGRIVEEGFLNGLGVLLNLLLTALALFAGLGLKGVLAGIWLGSILLCFLVLYLGFRWNLLKRHFVFSKSIWRPLVTYGLKLHVGTIFQSLNYRFDMYLVFFLLGSTSVGLYTVAVAIGEWLWLFPSILGVVIMQRAATRPEKETNVMVGPLHRLTSGVLFVGTIALGLLGNWVIRLLYGEAFSPSSRPLFLLLPGIWALGLWKNFMNDLSVRSFPAIKSYTSGVAVLLTVILDIILIPRWGISGAAIASSIAYITALGTALPVYCRMTHLSPWDLLIPRSGDLNLVLEKVKGSWRDFALKHELRCYDE